MKCWFPDWTDHLWKWDDAIDLFGLEHRYDFFYACLAWDELVKRFPFECKRYLGAYLLRYQKAQLKPRSYWIGEYGVAPNIDF